jgi:hypothetical protein
MNKRAMIGACLALGAVMTLGVMIPNVYAARGVKVDCGQVMKELDGGKKPKEVAADMKISVSSVYRCRKHAHQTTSGTAHAMNAHPMASASPSAAHH